ncbi:unnamed protein product [Diabrotica balteata]|uniref:DUF4371 domain-containing protein n=1 Tax=Diabrotica balteata TaxID=107213 RepID=A0A9N9T2Q8_DIABA|nr:unnamed protein product [Diabrotica balteata]
MSFSDALPGCSNSNVDSECLDIVVSLLELPLSRRTEVDRKKIIMNERPTPTLRIDQKDGKKGLAFRGHDESDDSLNPGNFKAIWELILKSTPELNDHWQKKIYFRGISKTIQNELIDLVKDEIHIFIENAINNSTFFACIVDETTDITERAQCSIVCRLVDTKGVVQEYFLGFFDLGEDRSAPALRDLLLSVIGIPAYFHQSSKRPCFLNKILGKRIPTNSEIRWNSNAKVVYAVSQERKKLLQVFQDIMNCPESNAKSIRQADGFKLIYFNKQLLYNILQKKNNDVQLCANSVSRCVAMLKSWRNDLTFSNHFNISVSETHSEPILSHSELDILPGSVSNNGDQSFLEKAKTKFRRVFFEILDNIITQLEQRFLDYAKFQFLELGDNKRFTEYGAKFPQKALDSLMDTYEPLFNKSLLKTELEIIFSAIHRENFHDKSLLELIKSMFDNETNEILPESYYFSYFVYLLQYLQQALQLKERSPL